MDRLEVLRPDRGHAVSADRARSRVDPVGFPAPVARSPDLPGCVDGHACRTNVAVAQDDVPDERAVIQEVTDGPSPVVQRVSGPDVVVTVNDAALRSPIPVGGRIVRAVREAP